MITVHIGLHKTGSTSIQAAVDRRLGRRALVPRSGDLQDDDSVFERLSKAASKVEVISDENLLGSPFDGYARARERLDILQAALSGVPFTLVVYFRPQVTWLESVYIQHVQVGGTESVDTVLAQIEASPYLEWHHLLDTIRELAGAERVLGRAFVHGRDAVRDFFEVAGLGNAPGRRASVINASVAPMQVPLLRLVNEAEGLTRADRQVVRGVLQDLVPRLPGRSSVFTANLQARLSEQYEVSWGRLAAADECSDDRAAFEQAQGAAREQLPYAGGSILDAAPRDEVARVLVELSRYRMTGARSLASRLARRLGS